MYKLMLCPAYEGYAFNLGNDVVSTEVSVGLPRQRVNSVGAVHRGAITYKCKTEMEYNYLTAFLRVNRAKSFLARLYLDSSELKWYECRVVQETHPVETNGTFVQSVTLNMMIKPSKYKEDEDKAFIAIYEMTNGDPDKYFNILEKLVNVDLANGLEKYDGIH